MVQDAILIGLLKFSFQRLRPTNPEIKIKVCPDILVDRYSFPSGHASRAVMITLLILNIFSDELSYSIIIFLIILAVITCLSRFLLARHYFTDVLVGTIIGRMNFLFSLYLIDNYNYFIFLKNLENYF